jgi:spore coat protein U-like protein
MKIQARKALLPTLAVCGAAALIGVIGYGSAVAATVTTTMGVSLTITAGCVTTATPLAFGSTGVLAAPIAQTSTVNVTCTNTTPYNVGLGLGVQPATLQRNMSAGSTGLVSYNLWRNSGHTLAWGETVNTDTVAGTGTGISQPITVYGEVIAQTSPAPGAYADSVVVTITF